MTLTGWSAYNFPLRSLLSLILSLLFSNFLFSQIGMRRGSHIESCSFSEGGIVKEGNGNGSISVDVLLTTIWTSSWVDPSDKNQSPSQCPHPGWTRQNQSESQPLGASALVGCHVLRTQETNNPLAVLYAANQQHFRCTPWNTPSVLLLSGACALSFSTWLITNKKQCDIWQSPRLPYMNCWISYNSCELYFFFRLQIMDTKKSSMDFKQIWFTSLFLFSFFLLFSFIFVGNCRNIIEFCKACFFLQAFLCCFNTVDSWHAVYGNTSSHVKETVMKWMEILCQEGLDLYFCRSFFFFLFDILLFIY